LQEARRSDHPAWPFPLYLRGYLARPGRLLQGAARERPVPMAGLRDVPRAAGPVLQA